MVHGVKVSGLVTLESGRRFNIFAGRDFNLDGNPNSDRPGFVERNCLRGAGVRKRGHPSRSRNLVNDRARLELMLDVFNLFDRVNVKDINTVWGGIDYPGTPPPATLGFGTPRDIFNPFQTQIGAKLDFRSC